MAAIILFFRIRQAVFLNIFSLDLLTINCKNLRFCHICIASKNLSSDFRKTQVWFMAATGARISELLQIKMEHVQAGFIDLCTKGGKIRRIYIPKKLAIAALEWLQDQKIESGFIFLNHLGRLISREGIATR
jgi:integrase